jgi:hypothetical protein
MSFRSINAVTRSLTALLEDHLAGDPTLRPFFDSGIGGSFVVSPRSPEEMADADRSGLSLWLYRIERDPELLNLPQRRLAVDRVEPHRLPLRLHYLVTPVVNSDEVVGNDPGLEQFVIGKVLQTFLDHPRLSGPALLGDLAGSDATIAVRLEPMALDQISRVWDALGATLQLCISYEVTFTMICSDAAPVTVSPVDKVEVGTGLILEAPGP